ncbi:MAG: hypothetical protein Q9174_000839 [Haloplaca sp. 1 TL-2023]
MANAKVFITGASEFVGFQTLLCTLKAGYVVLAAVACQEKADLIRSAPSIRQLNPGPSLSFVTIPDLAADNALTDAVKGDIQYIIHAASPGVNLSIPADQYDNKIIHPIVKSTDNVLSAAMQNQHVKRVVMTSSESAVIPYTEEYVLASFTTFTGDSPIPDVKPPYKTAFAARSAAEAKALSSSNSFLAKHKPHFTVVSLLPATILGNDELAQTPKDLLQGSNLQALRHLRGDKVKINIPSHTVHVDDVARANVLSLDTQKVPKTQDLIVASGGITGSAWYRGKEIVKKSYANAVKKGWLSLDGEQPVNPVHVDSKKTQEVLGLKPADFEKQIKDLLDQYVALKAKEEKD